MRARRRVATAALGACLVLTGCGLFGDGPPPRPCPPVFVLEEADRLTKFRAGPGRDITDIAFEARIADFTGSCEDDDGKMELDLAIDFAVERGPANRSNEARFTYFVAIPKFYPQPEGKRRFDVVARFEGGRTRGVRREELNLNIPVPKGQSTRDFEIYLGIQLSPEELEFNKERTGQ